MRIYKLKGFGLAQMADGRYMLLMSDSMSVRDCRRLENITRCCIFETNSTRNDWLIDEDKAASIMQEFKMSGPDARYSNWIDVKFDED
jgi:hypothetical protein